MRLMIQLLEAAARGMRAKIRARVQRTPLKMTVTGISARMTEKVKAKRIGIAARMTEKVKAKRTGIAAMMTEKVEAKMTGMIKGKKTQKVKAKILIISPGRSQTHLTTSSVFTPSRRQTRL
ncbi:unnamed protein product [Arctogadus glacialis]